MMGNERGRRGRQTERHSQGERKGARGGEEAARGGKERKNSEGGLIEKRETQSRVGTFLSFCLMERTKRGPRERERATEWMKEGERESERGKRGDVDKAARLWRTKRT